MSARHKDLLLAAVMLGIALTPAWLTPRWFALPWLGLTLVLVAPTLWLSWTHGPFVPTPTAELARIVDALELSAGQRFCDLGSGDGRILLGVCAATGATGVGVEAAPLLVLLSRLRILLARIDATVRMQDLYAADLSSFDAVYVWGTAYSVGTPRFRALVQGSMRPGARLVSYHTPIPGMEPTDVFEGGQRPIYRYVL